jgi:DNA polymerase iota
VSLLPSSCFHRFRDLISLIGQAVRVGEERDIVGPNVVSTTNAPDVILVPEDRHDSLQAYLDPLPARSIQGFGSAVLATLATAHPALPEKPTIHDLRTTSSQAAFRRLLPSSTAIPLWDLLHGRDEAPVKPSPQYPAQISVEDSSASDLWRTFPSIRTQGTKTLAKLMERMEEELTMPPGEPYADGITFHPRPISANSSWIRYPSQLRLTIRTYTSTQSKSAAMPAFVFDVSISKQERAERIMKSLVDRMIRSLLGKGRAGIGETEYEVYV